MPRLFTNMDTLVDMNYFNSALLMGGGKMISNKQHLISMRKFITILLKLFKKDYNKKINSYKNGGYAEYSHAYNYSDLEYSNPYPFPLASAVDRSFT
jgi:hypothetical protein